MPIKGTGNSPWVDTNWGVWRTAADPAAGSSWRPERRGRASVGAEPGAGPGLEEMKGKSFSSIPQRNVEKSTYLKKC